MRVAFASDHAGFEQKQMLIEYVSGLGHEVIDLGPDSEQSVDYPDYGEKLGRFVAAGDADRGVAVCGTGIGISMAAGKVAGVRAASITSPEFADLFRRHNDGNVIGLSGRFVAPELNRDIVKVFLTSEFEGGRHAKRVAKIMKLDATGKCEPAAKPPVMPLNR